MSEDLDEFAEGLHAELRHEADREGAEAMMAEAFTRHMIDVVLETGVMDELVDCFHTNDSVRPAVEVSGYGLQDGDTLNLVTTLYRGGPVGRLEPREVRRALSRAEAFFQRCLPKAKRGSYRDGLEEASEAWGMVADIEAVASKIARVHVALLTDQTVDLDLPGPQIEDGVEYRQSVFDIRRLARLQDPDGLPDPVEIDFLERFGEALAVLPAPSQSDEYEAFVTIIPGEWIAALYDEFGSRLLERNVRSFLQFTGKVNRGIRDTIRKEPNRFLAYNNGISATAADVALDEDGGIVRLVDFQVVNGGQTTASIHRMLRDGTDLSSVSVQAKITVVDGDLVDELVPKISEYSNSQNKIQIADLAANNPFHIGLENLSRDTWAPPVGTSSKQTKWFYERARGQYRDEEARAGTPARKREFREIYPTRQKFAKVDLAVFENTWDQLPHEVNKGAQKNFTAFMTRRAEMKSPPSPDAGYFQRAVAKAILFRRTEAIVSSLDLGGYRRPVVSYALARLSHATSKRLNLQQIWADQAVPDAVVDAVESLALVAWGVLTDEDRPTANVTEWAKSPKCWDAMKRSPWVVPAALDPYLVTLAAGATSAGTAGDGEAPADGAGGAAADAGLSDLVTEMSAVPPEVFFAIANWAKQTDNLTAWDRKFSFSIGLQLGRGKVLSEKQAGHAKRILDEARDAGFDPLDVEPPEED